MTEFLLYTRELLLDILLLPIEIYPLVTASKAGPVQDHCAPKEKGFILRPLP